MNKRPLYAILQYKNRHHLFLMSKYLCLKDHLFL